ncbi:MerR family transcriptional regulator [Paenibacillus sediminis]|nr:MerR family transcriptional regulator [Paenibacillus sediminis]
MKIKELAAKLQITPRAIRFYEEKGLIHPAKQPNNDYRLFSENDAWRIQTISSLREVGMSIDHIRAVLSELDDGNDNEILYYLEQQRSAMYSQWIELKQMIQTTDEMIDLLKQQKTLQIEHIVHLANGSKRLRDLRKTWSDRWNFDRQASFYDELVTSRQAINLYENYEQALDLTLAWVTPSKTEKGLDIGTGTGNLAGRFLQAGIPMAAIDQSKQMLKQCQMKYPHLETKLGNFLAIPYLDDQFDFIVTSYALHHLTDEQKLIALEEMARVLQPHGRICITDLMFENEAARSRYLRELEQQGAFEMKDAILDEYYADKSLILDWFEKKGYMTRHEQLSDLLHIVYAVPIRKR